MRFPQIILLAFWLCCLGCSDDDPGDILIEVEETVSQENFPAFSFLTTTQEGIQQYVFDVATQTGSLSNLSIQEGVSPFANNAFIANNVAGLYFQNQVWLKNLETGNIVSGENFFSQTDDIFNNWTVNSTTTVYTGFHDGGAFENFNVRAQNIVTNTQTEFNIGNIGQSAPATFGNNHLIFHNNFSSGSNGPVATLGLINTEINASVGLITLEGDLVIGSIFGQNNDVFVFSTEDRYHRFDLSTFNLIETFPTSFRAALNGREGLNNNQIFYTFIQPQPSILDASPAVYNLTTNTNTIVDIITSFQTIQEERLYTSIQPTDMQYSAIEEAWIVGYSFSSITGSGGGVFKIDLSGSILAEIQLDVAPDTLVLFE